MVTSPNRRRRDPSPPPLPEWPGETDQMWHPPVVFGTAWLQALLQGTSRAPGGARTFVAKCLAETPDTPDLLLKHASILALDAKYEAAASSSWRCIGDCRASRRYSGGSSPCSSRCATRGRRQLSCGRTRKQCMMILGSPRRSSSSGRLGSREALADKEFGSARPSDPGISGNPPRGTYVNR